jgi:hypothetical protein
MLHRQRWRPDTCDCVLIETWDDANPEAEHVWQASEMVCPAHLALGLLPTAAHHAFVLAENRRKNRGLALVLARHTGLTFDNVTWALDAARVVRLRIVGATIPTSQLNATRTALTTEFGGGVVLD